MSAHESLWVIAANAAAASTSVQAAVAAASVALPVVGDGNTTGIVKKMILSCVGAAHVRFGATGITATTFDMMITSSPRYLFRPGGATHLAYIANAATTSTLNIAGVEF